MKKRSFIASIVLALLIVLTGAQGRMDAASRPRAHRTATKSTASKSVHVRAYTKKNGTHVAAYNRRPPSRHAPSTKRTVKGRTKK